MERVIGERELITMKKKANGLDMPMGKLIKIPDFLPSPQELVVPENSVKVTIALTKSSLDFFKREAKRHHTKYQKMIRALVDQYANRYQN